ncbi:hypothetical protein JCM10207_008484 [Rhodosporidiobolus poonsookiae]
MNFLSIRKRNKDKDTNTTDSLSRTTSRSSVDSEDERSRGRSSIARSLSPWRRSSKHRARSSSNRRDTSAEGVRGDDTDAESEYEGRHPVPAVVPSNAFESDSDDDDRSSVASGDDDYEIDDDDDEWELDEELERNTEANASADTPLDYLTREGASTMIYPGEGPNLLPPIDPLTASITSLNASSPSINPRSGLPSTSAAPSSGGGRLNPRTGLPQRRKSTKSAALPRLELKTSRPVFEKNRCTVTLVHGDPDGVCDKQEHEGGRKRRRRYLVASDLSEESLYAIQWAIGTVLREGDECIIVSVMETDTKLDPDDLSSSSARASKQANQRERQIAALQLSRQATQLLERTRLNVRVVCQAIHAKVPRHMLVDMIDFFEPTLVLVGSRGLTKLKGMLLGSVSNYLIQKSSSPVMVTRRPLRLSRTVHRKLASLDRAPRVALADAQIDKESHGQAVDQPAGAPGEGAEGEEVREEVRGMEVGGEK